MRTRHVENVRYGAAGLKSARGPAAEMKQERRSEGRSLTVAVLC
jgi:hypothetical protein